MKIVALAGALALTLAGPWTALAQAQAPAPAPSRAAVTVTKVVSSIPDGVEWGTVGVGDACQQPEHLRWNMGKGMVDVPRLAQPVRDEFRREHVAVAADPNDPFGGRITSDLMVGATITGITAKFCGGGDAVTGQVDMHVVWEVFSVSQRKVVVAVRTNVTIATRDKPVAVIRLLGDAVAGSAKQLMLNGEFERVLVTAAGAAPPAPGAPRPSGPSVAGQPSPAEQFGPGTAHGDLAPHAQARLSIGGQGRSMKINDAVSSVVAVLRTNSIGSAFLISQDGYLMTAAHVVGADQYVKILWSDGSQSTGEVVRRDNRRDVALIKTDPGPHRALAVHPQKPPVGEQVYAIGAPRGLQGTVTRGIVSADRAIDGFTFIQSDAAVNPGNSGGPLLDEQGAVLGIADLSDRANPGINFFVPMSDALVFLGVDLR